MINKILLIIRSAIFFASVPLFTVFFTLFSLPFVRHLPYKRRFLYMITWSKVVLYLARIICRIEVNLEGQEHIPNKKAFVMMANHQSEWETFFLVNLIAPVKIVCKSSLLRLPLGVGYGIRLMQPLAVERNKPKTAVRKIFTEGKKTLLEDNLPLLIFPQGTRAKASTNSTFAKLGAKLAIETETPIIFVSHDAGKCWPEKGFLKYPGKINVSIKPAVYTSKNTSNAEAIMDEGQMWINERLAKFSEQTT